MSQDDYDKLLQLQNGVCAICQQECSTKRSLAVDHDHQTGQVRALLCRDCNITIGLMKEDAARLRAAADYIEKYNSKEPDGTRLQSCSISLLQKCEGAP